MTSKRGLIEAQRAEIKFLREQLRRREDENERLLDRVMMLADRPMPQDMPFTMNEPAEDPIEQPDMELYQ